jgi:hypothetical protein
MMLSAQQNQVVEAMPVYIGLRGLISGTAFASGMYRHISPVTVPTLSTMAREHPGYAQMLPDNAKSRLIVFSVGSAIQSPQRPS